MPIEFLDPRPSVRISPALTPSPHRVATRPEAASRVGLLANGFPDSEAFLDALAASLSSLRADLTFVSVAKARPPDPLDEAQVDALTGCDAVIAAYGH